VLSPDVDVVLRVLVRDGVRYRGFVKPMRKSRRVGGGCCAAEAPVAATSAERDSPEKPIRHKEQLVEHLLRGAKPAAAWRVGLEYERLGLEARSGRAIPYFGPRGVEAVLQGLAETYGWESHDEDGHMIGLRRCGSAITLEPGGQLELSGRPHRLLTSMREEIAQHFLETAAVSDALDVRWVPVGLHPITPIERIEWVPKKRYAILAPFLAARGALALHMMKGTAAVQVNLDYDSLDDAADKYRTANGITGILTAICANSPLYGGRPNGFQSRRARIWEETDPQRCGLPEFAFVDGLSICDYVEYALDVPMVFALREGRWLSMHGLPFRKFLHGGYRGLQPTLADWALHLTSIYPEVRLKTHLEVRGADSVPPDLAMALAALWKGILYDDGARRDAWRLVSRRSKAARLAFRREVALKGPEARLGVDSARDLAAELLRLARGGLQRMLSRPQGPPAGAGEADFLNPLEELVLARTRAPAAGLLERWQAGEDGPRTLLEEAAADARRFTAMKR
jgi:glutamate--cysteine ligase